VPGTPLIHVKAYTVMGDVKVRSSGVEESVPSWRHRLHGEKQHGEGQRGEGQRGEGQHGEGQHGRNRHGGK
jgi:hypothetical protein